MAGFLFGPGTGETASSLRERRKLAKVLLGGSIRDTPRNVGEGIDAVTGAFAGRILEDRANKGIAEGEAGAAKLFQAALGGGPAQPQAAGLFAPRGVTQPSNQPNNAGVPSVEAPTALAPAGDSDIASRLMSDLQNDFGLSREQAAGVTGNLAHETGNFANLQEKNPLVPGSRGGFGYAQWTGPRRRQFEAWVQQNGLDPNSYAANYGFLKHELSNTPEGSVLDSLRHAQTPDDAARIVSNKFLRPGIPHMGSRLSYANKFAGLPPAQQAIAQVAQASPETLTDAVPDAPLPGFGPQGDPNGAALALTTPSEPQQDAFTPQPVQTQRVTPEPAQQQPQQVAQAQQQVIDPRMIEALSNPFMPDDQKRILMGILQQRMKLQAQQNDPMRALQMQNLQSQIDKRSADTSGGPTFSKTPVYGTDENGNTVLGTIGDNGTFKKLDTGNFTVANGFEKIDTGTEVIFRDKRTGQIANVTPKANFEAERQKAEGKSAGKTSGEALASFQSMQSKMPGLIQVVEELDKLADTATYTLGEQALNAGAKQLGFEPTQGAVDRAKYIAMVDNQVLPLLRDTFGAAFTVKEGESLRATLGDPDKHPKEKKAVLQSFIEQKRRNIEALANQTGQQPPPPAPVKTKRLRYNPQTGKLE